MRCEKCGTLIEGSNGTCPLCGAPLAKEEEVFAPRRAKVSRVIVPFTEVYFSLTIVATVVIGIINYFYRNDLQYWLIGLMGAWYIYFTLRRTILGLENTHYKILGQSITILIFLYTVAAVLHAQAIFVWAIPAFYGATWLVGGIFALVKPNRALRHLSSLWAQNLLGAGIVIACFAMHLYWVPSVVAGGLGIVLGLVLTILRPRELWSQIKRTLDK